MKNGLMIGHYLLAAIVAGALATQVSLAEEAGPSGHQGSGAGAAGNAATPANHGATEGPAGPKGESGAATKGTNAGADGGAKDNPIDTRITVQQGRTPGKTGTKVGDPGKIGTANPSGIAGERRQISAPAAIGGAKNAIGLSVNDHAGAKGTDTGHQGSAPSGQGAGPSAIGGAAKAAVGNAAVGSSGAKLANPGASPIATTTAINRATINGTGLARPGSGPGIVGGPAKTVAGINGTSIRPKH
jgi:hypothetical protein